MAQTSEKKEQWIVFTAPGSKTIMGFFYTQEEAEQAVKDRVATGSYARHQWTKKVDTDGTVHFRALGTQFTIARL